jgi:hypothetical protein
MDAGVLAMGLVQGIGAKLKGIKDKSKFIGGLIASHDYTQLKSI